MREWSARLASRSHSPEMTEEASRSGEMVERLLAVPTIHRGLLVKWPDTNPPRGKCFDIQNPPDDAPDTASMEWVSMIAEATGILLLSLMTQNIVKREWKNRGVGLSQKHFTAADGSLIYISNTRLELPEQLDDDADHPPAGKTKAAHMRRGHVHHYWYGPHDGERVKKRLFVKAVYVNGDPAYVEKARQDRRYKVVP